ASPDGKGHSVMTDFTPRSGRDDVAWSQVPGNGSAVSEASRRKDSGGPGEVDRRIAFDTAV
ncbi:MAG TPA: hypothetical protein VF852_08800, partial [Pseudolabrys sp.]